MTLETPAPQAERQVVTISFFRYQGLKKVWGMQQMQMAKSPLNTVPGLQFFKLLGSGDGFSLKPDFSTYGLLCVWDNIEVARNFFHKSAIFERFRRNSSEQWTVYMHPVLSHGYWSGVAPFQSNKNTSVQNEPLAVITRATLQPGKIWKFWQYVPKVGAAVYTHEGLIFTKGIGEWPVIQQATFSLWRNKKDMIDFAYKNPYHTEVIRKTRELGWYKEELFAQFTPFYAEGSWNGVNPLADYLNPVHITL
jgi:hypothetical protein